MDMSWFDQKREIKHKYLYKIIVFSGYTLRVKLEKKNSETEANHSTCAARYEAWRNRLKKNKIAYQEFKVQDAARSKVYRHNLSEGKRNESNEYAKLRMRKYRKRKTEESHGKVKLNTRHRVEKQREYWRRKKAEERAKMSSQKKRRELEKRKAKYQSSKAKCELKFITGKSEVSRKLVTKCNMSLPKTPNFFAAAVETPQKRQAMKNKEIILTPKSKQKHETNAKIVARIKNSLNELKNDTSKSGRQRYRILTQSIVGRSAVEHSLRKELNMKWEYWNKVSQITEAEEECVRRNNSMPEENVQQIERFYLSESTILPTKKTVSIKTGKQKHIMTDTLQQAHIRFLKQNPSVKVSLIHFRKLRPKEVLTVNKHKFNSCLCEYCLNVQYKLDTLNQVSQSMKKPELKVKSKYLCVEKSMCQKNTESNFAKMIFIERECNSCGESTLQKHFEPLLEFNENDTCQWKCWEYRTVKNRGKEERKQVLVDKAGSLKHLIDELCKEVNFLSKHLFVAEWQYRQFNYISKHIPKSWLVTIADFSENYRCTAQYEIQSAYYNYHQVTVHPMLAYYNCPDCTEVVQESVVFISDDLDHDPAAVEQFSKCPNAHLRNTRGLNYNHEVQFSDGCASQYKSKVSFQNLSTLDHHFERSFFGSRHGKGPCDALGGIVKKGAETYVKSRRGTIRNADEMFTFCEAHLKIGNGSKCEHKRRAYFYFEKINKGKKSENLKTFKGTRQLHSVRAVEPGVVEGRNLSCFCVGCTSPVGEPKSDSCTNKAYISEWKTHHLSCTREARVNSKKKKLVPNISSKKPKIESRNQKQSKQITEQTVLSSEITFKQTLDTFRKARTYEELKLLVFSNPKEMESIRVQPCNFVDSTSFVVDKIALDLLPEDIPDQDTLKFPVRVGADGNCLPRCGSIHAFGNEEHHEQIRARIVLELVKNADMYLDFHQLARGTSLSDHDASKLPSRFATYSPKYTAGDILTEHTIRRIYQQEVLDISQKNSFMGIWQLFGLASVLRCRIFSVYPNRGNLSVRQDLHRQIFPIGPVEHEAAEVGVMWTTTREDMTRATHWIPNHFVPLVSIDAPRFVSNSSTDPGSTSIVECSFSEDEDQNKDSSGLIDILQYFVGEVSISW